MWITVPIYWLHRCHFILTAQFSGQGLIFLQIAEDKSSVTFTKNCFARSKNLRNIGQIKVLYPWVVPAHLPLREILQGELN